jgi:hypothetical protein
VTSIDAAGPPTTSRDQAKWIGRLAGIALLFLLFHLAFLPKSLEDVDSINFALGVRHFDVAQHQPHPPGYPVFIAVAKAVNVVTGSEVRTFALIGIIALTAATFALFRLFVAFDPVDANAEFWAFSATALAISAPLFWITASRPLSDAPGLAAALGIQALTLSAATTGGLTFAAFLAGLGIGVRSQILWLCVPLIAFAYVGRVLVDPPARRVPKDPAHVLRHARIIVAFIVGALVWAIPLVMLTGGPRGYIRAVQNQGSEDLTNIVMLWTTHTVREVALALYYAFIAPWALTPVAVIVLVLAAVGTVQILRRRPSALLLLAVAFGPYLVFDLVFQETITTRYSLPLVVPLAYLAVRGASLLGTTVASAGLIVLVMFNAHLGGTSLAAYARDAAPAFRLIDGMKSEASSAKSPPVLAMDRREDSELRRAFTWTGLPAVERRLPAPAKHEWLELAKYWTSGGRKPIWFIADPLRSDLALLGVRETPEQFRWQMEQPILIGGTRPGEMDWYVIPPPDWYLGEGWALTPETAGVAKEDHRGPGPAPIEGWVHRWISPVTMMVGGRNLSNAGPDARVRVAIDGRQIDEWTVPPGFFLREITLPASTLAGTSDYASLTVAAQPVGSGTADVAIEQFDARPDSEIVFGYGEGWHEQEYNPQTGKLWRWTSDRGVIRVHTPQQALLLTLDGEVEAASRSHVTIKIGERILAAYDIGETFSIKQPIPKEAVANGDNLITITTDHAYVPAERRSRTQDRRLLGLKVYDCRIKSTEVKPPIGQQPF